MSAHREVAKRMRDVSRRTLEHHVNDLMYAVVKSVDPLSVQGDAGLVLDDDDLVLGHTVRRFDHDEGLEVGDTLVVKKMGNDDWLAIEVVTDRDLTMFAEAP
jgi:hypothetical protein